ncbi:DUF5134 domain-containing protein [Nocardia terpenica]|uniref:DUF5134 domain-containing protein n=1 Tax=Nocardia terpenica TaxID=455432 RepID=UPI001895557A|nr:DUF5134 domain-containing protein [Nocardia terpenica]MBF6065592.1 DUF5134 domain-containing protein [Nocardia terpenica]MBF6108606.1 DUF5134 domain-containing protein [Nocardia terpenica]MBF6115636.1 DUF5134 domain-containing protein [Nocardia terpenica]MBF6122837.1 DUF5134 domain-containing protein [Nocardia terpenica]MBF6155811.1 DUF5134 domain-containing protein [Nocardia terpenica]
MGAFATQYAALRWIVAAAFVGTALIVAARSITLPVSDNAGGQRVSAPAVDHESDAAHLLMCLVMLTMLLFPAAAPEAVRGVLTALTVVFAALLAARMLRWRRGSRAESAGRAAALGYHLVAAAAMTYTMSGAMSDAMPGHAGLAHRVLLALAALFALDAVLMLTPGTKAILRHTIPHPAGVTGPIAAVPHLVMDLGMAYMLIAATM